MTAALGDDDSEGGAAEDRDRVIFQMRDLVRDYPNDVLNAGARLQARAIERMRIQAGVIRAKAVAERARIERARRIALGEEAGPKLPEGVRSLDERVREQEEILMIRDLTSGMRSYQQRNGDLHSVSALAAHVDEFVVAYQRSCSQSRAARRTDEEIRNQRMTELDPEHRGDGLLRAAFYIALEIRDIVDSSPNQLLRSDDWWEIVVAALICGDMDTQPAQLGITAELREREWDQRGDDTFAHREGIRAYGSLDPDRVAIPREKRNWNRLWSLGARAVAHLHSLYADRPAATSSVRRIAANLSEAIPSPSGRDPAPHSESGSGMLSVVDLAQRHGVAHEKLRKRLDRWRIKHMEGGWVEVSDRRSRAPRYLYSEVAVLPIIRSLQGH